MRIHIDQLKESRLALEFSKPADRFSALRKVTAAGDGSFTGPVRTSVTAERVGELVEIRGVTRAVVRQSCGRCLAEFDSPVETEFELTYARRGEGPNGAADLPRSDPAPDDGLIYFHGDEIDLTAGVQEHLILSLPLKPLCREDCKGPLRALRRRSQPGAMRLCGGLGRRPLRNPEAAEAARNPERFRFVNITGAARRGGKTAPAG